MLLGMCLYRGGDLVDELLFVSLLSALRDRELSGGSDGGAVSLGQVVYDEHWKLRLAGLFLDGGYVIEDLGHRVRALDRFEPDPDWETLDLLHERRIRGARSFGRRFDLRDVARVAVELLAREGVAFGRRGRDVDGRLGRPERCRRGQFRLRRRRRSGLRTASNGGRSRQAGVGRCGRWSRGGRRRGGLPSASRGEDDDGSDERGGCRSDHAFPCEGESMNGSNLCGIARGRHAALRDTHGRHSPRRWNETLQRCGRTPGVETSTAQEVPARRAEPRRSRWARTTVVRVEESRWRCSVGVRKLVDSLGLPGKVSSRS